MGRAHGCPAGEEQRSVLEPRLSGFRVYCVLATQSSLSTTQELVQNTCAMDRTRR